MNLYIVALVSYLILDIILIQLIRFSPNISITSIVAYLFPYVRRYNGECPCGSKISSPFDGMGNDSPLLPLALAMCILFLPFMFFLALKDIYILNRHLRKCLVAITNRV